MMKKRAVVEIEGDLADESERVLPVFVIVNADVSCHQAAKGIEGEVPDGGFDAMLVQFFDDEVAPLPADADLDVSNLMHAADIWHDVKKHWCLAAQRAIRAARRSP